MRPGPTLSLAFPERFQGDSHLEQSGCHHHCVDENIERRNHYLDLAGIENYTSQFGPGKGAPLLERVAGEGVPGRAGGQGGGVHWPPGLGGGGAFTRVKILKTFERCRKLNKIKYYPRVSNSVKTAVQCCTLTHPHPVRLSCSEDPAPG